jgi:hypothetical protein
VKVSVRVTMIGGALALVELLGILAGSADANVAIDPTLPARRVVGRQTGPTAVAGRSGATWSPAGSRLPAKPHLLWRTRLESGIEHGITVDPRGNVVVATFDSLSELGRDGHLLWSVHLDARPTTAPTLLSDGKRAVVVANGTLVATTPDGGKAWTRSIPCPANVSSARVLPWTDGGLVLAAGEGLLWMDGGGDWRASASVPARITGLLERRRAVLAMTQAGDVFTWDGVGLPRRLATFGGRTELGAVPIGDNVLAAVVDEKRLVEVDLVTSAIRVRVADGPLSYRWPVVVTKRGETRILSADGLLLGHDTEGRETLRISLDPAGAGRDAGVLAQYGAGNAALLVDARDAVAFMCPGQDPGVVSPDKGVWTLAATACVDPVTLVAAGTGRLAGACRSGVVWLAADEPPGPEAPRGSPRQRAPLVDRGARRVLERRSGRTRWQSSGSALYCGQRPAN